MGRREEEEKEAEDVVVPQQPLKEDSALSTNDFELLKSIRIGKLRTVIKVGPIVCL